MPSLVKPGLYGIHYSNRDFSSPDSWGKNQFNSSFPAALSALMHQHGLPNIYITVDKSLKINHKTISTHQLYGLPPSDDNLFYAFESIYTPYQQFVLGSLPRVDLVTQRRDTGTCLSGLEVKLTALPDNSTCHLAESKYGCELVIRPDTVVYLACSILKHYREKLDGLRIPKELEKIKDWTEPDLVLPRLAAMTTMLDHVFTEIQDKQEPLLMQPVWKTEGKSPRLAEHCLDVFIWSNLAFAKLFLDVAKTESRANKITRPIRTAIWLCKMLFDFSKNGQINPEQTIDRLSFNTKNDKAFALSGRMTQPYMDSPQLLKPRIPRNQIKDIILGGGQNLLSPERRFDAIIYNSPEIFT